MRPELSQNLHVQVLKARALLQRVFESAPEKRFHEPDAVLPHFFLLVSPSGLVESKFDLGWKTCGFQRGEHGHGQHRAELFSHSWYAVFLANSTATLRARGAPQSGLGRTASLFVTARKPPSLAARWRQREGPRWNRNTRTCHS